MKTKIHELLRLIQMWVISTLMMVWLPLNMGHAEEEGGSKVEGTTMIRYEHQDSMIDTSEGADDAAKSEIFDRELVAAIAQTIAEPEDSDVATFLHLCGTVVDDDHYVNLRCMEGNQIYKDVNLEDSNFNVQYVDGWGGPTKLQSLLAGSASARSEEGAYLLSTGLQWCALYRGKSNENIYMSCNKAKNDENMVNSPPTNNSYSWYERKMDHQGQNGSISTDKEPAFAWNGKDLCAYYKGRDSDETWTFCNDGGTANKLMNYENPSVSNQYESAITDFKDLSSNLKNKSESSRWFVEKKVDSILVGADARSRAQDGLGFAADGRTWCGVYKRNADGDGKEGISMLCAEPGMHPMQGGDTIRGPMWIERMLASNNEGPAPRTKWAVDMATDGVRWCIGYRDRDTNKVAIACNFDNPRTSKWHSRVLGGWVLGGSSSNWKPSGTGVSIFTDGKNSWCLSYVKSGQDDVYMTCAEGDPITAEWSDPSQVFGNVRDERPGFAFGKSCVSPGHKPPNRITQDGNQGRMGRKFCCANEKIDDPDNPEIHGRCKTPGLVPIEIPEENIAEVSMDPETCIVSKDEQMRVAHERMVTAFELLFSMVDHPTEGAFHCFDSRLSGITTDTGHNTSIEEMKDSVFAEMREGRYICAQGKEISSPPGDPEGSKFLVYNSDDNDFLDSPFGAVRKLVKAARARVDGRVRVLHKMRNSLADLEQGYIEAYEAATKVPEDGSINDGNVQESYQQFMLDSIEVNQTYFREMSDELYTLMDEFIDVWVQLSWEDFACDQGLVTTECGKRRIYEYEGAPGNSKLKAVYVDPVFPQGIATQYENVDKFHESASGDFTNKVKAFWDDEVFHTYDEAILGLGKNAFEHFKVFSRKPNMHFYYPRWMYLKQVIESTLWLADYYAQMADLPLKECQEGLFAGGSGNGSGGGGATIPTATPLPGAPIPTGPGGPGNPIDPTSQGNADPTSGNTNLSTGNAITAGGSVVQSGTGNTTNFGAGAFAGGSATRNAANHRSRLKQRLSKLVPNNSNKKHKNLLSRNQKLANQFKNMLVPKLTSAPMSTSAANGAHGMGGQSALPGTDPNATTADDAKKDDNHFSDQLKNLGKGSGGGGGYRNKRRGGRSYGSGGESGYGGDGGGSSYGSNSHGGNKHGDMLNKINARDFAINDDDSLFDIITKRYIVTGFPILLEEGEEEKKKK